MPHFQASVLLLLLTTQLVAPMVMRRRPPNHGRIIGGSDASIADYPWQLALLLAGYQSCGASIISPEWALTAGHCIPYTEVFMFNLRAGSSSRDSGGTVLDITEMYVHEQRNATSGDYDIAVVRAAGSFPLGDNVAIVSLPEDGYDPPVGLAATVTGWGNTETGDNPDTLQKVDISVMDHSACQDQNFGRPQLTARMLCAGQAGRSSCFGDSGGPLVGGGTQVGIVSWVVSLQCETAGGVYTNVGNLRSWITRVAGV